MEMKASYQEMKASQQKEGSYATGNQVYATGFRENQSITPGRDESISIASSRKDGSSTQGCAADRGIFTQRDEGLAWQVATVGQRSPAAEHPIGGTQHSVWFWDLPCIHIYEPM